MNVTIICSSMPAFAAISRTVTKSKYLASLRDRFTSYLATSKPKRGSKSQSLARTKRLRLRDDRSETFARSYVGQYSELNDGPNASKAAFPSVLTRIHADAGGDLEEGIILESVSVEQTAHEQHVADHL